MPRSTSSNDDAFPTSDAGFEEISLLPIDHPGAYDRAYRARRDFIALLAKLYREDPNHVIPRVSYTEQETWVWRHIYDRLEEAHERRASSLYLAGKRALGISRDEIPQLDAMTEQLRRLTNFRLAPIEGLVQTRAFLNWLGKRVMLCTQYIRHQSRPDYTPEPESVHEAIGHLPNFTDPDFADFSQFIGQGAAIADDQQLTQLGRLYWFTVEFGLIEEDGQIKAFGAGLLSSYIELEHAFSDQVERCRFELKEVIDTPYSYSTMQPRLFVIPSYECLKEATREFIKGF